MRETALVIALHFAFIIFTLNCQSNCQKQDPSFGQGVNDFIGGIIRNIFFPTQVIELLFMSEAPA